MVLGCCARISCAVPSNDCVGAAIERRAAREREQAAAEFNGGGLFDQALDQEC